MPLDAPPPRESRFGSPLELSRVHWVRPEMVVEVAYLTWTEDNLLRQVSYQGERQASQHASLEASVPRDSIITLCCSGDFTGTKRMVGRVTASQIASTSAASFF
ncbi:hypothetical protein NKJ26_20205 [Mesorhizobium sp. M0152]